MEGSPLAKDILMRPSRVGWNKKTEQAFLLQKWKDFPKVIEVHVISNLVH